MRSYLKPWSGFVLALCLVFTVEAQEGLTLNFKNTDITAVIQSVSALTGKNFIIDPRVKGKVNVISNGSMEPEEVYRVFLSILAVHGFTAVDSGAVIKIIPDATAKQNATPVIQRQPFDTDQVVTQVIPVTNVNAAQLVPILRPLVDQQGHLAAYAATNVVIISDRASNVRRILKLVQRIDLESDEEVEVVPLQFAYASEVIRLLSNLDSASGQAKNAAAKSVRFSADERTNSIIMSGERSKRMKYRAIITHLDTPVEQSGNTQVVYLKYADAKNIAQILGSVGKDLQKGEQKSAGNAASTQGAGLNIQADESANALVISASSAVMKSLKSVIQQLDIPRAQVHIEAVIAEVSLDTSKELGVQWVIDGTDKDQPALITNFAGSGTGVTALAGGAIGDGLTLGLGRVRNNDLSFVSLIRALNGDAESNLLSTPSIVTLDNQEAEIVVGRNVPFVTGEYSNTGGSGANVANPFRTIERQDIGISLKVKPQINEGDAITLQIEQEVSDISSSSTGAVDLITNKRSLKTTVQIEDSELLVLGGLIDETVIDSEQKVPGLGDIPIVGALFRSNKAQRVKRNLVVFIRPTIIKDASLARALSTNKYNKIRHEQLEMQERKQMDVPVLSELPDVKEPEQSSSFSNQDLGILYD